MEYGELTKHIKTFYICNCGVIFDNSLNYFDLYELQQYPFLKRVEYVLNCVKCKEA